MLECLFAVKAEIEKHFLEAPEESEQIAIHEFLMEVNEKIARHPSFIPTA